CAKWRSNYYSGTSNFDYW
nr:immunoglobulin heavy chain junction region [Macaca mulatta]MOW75562.1 immunoglobulin heavy chain junction region [Macaca mulatta]MOW76137.1 immunoglobulin heavy chain junction region [Macaca mulatta]MOW77047.1 immunoglobulin heavy chain junction region [Macaca mulatta]MOW77111.1 immunoglobulin heavy chain junction region [Macaca mulatta]